MNALRQGLPTPPARMASRPVDARGFPVPWFVAWIDGKPDHRVLDGAKLEPAIALNLCWQCGQQLGAFKSFVIGPMCTITRTISEPPSHRECACYAVTACPFLTRPHAKRREAGLPEEARDPAGEFIKRNPGAVCVWTTKTFKPFREGRGILFRIGDPTSTEWFAEGRPATRAEIDASIESGLPLLQAEQEGAAAVAELQRRLAGVNALLDAQFGALVA